MNVGIAKTADSEANMTNFSCNRKVGVTLPIRRCERCCGVMVFFEGMLVIAISERTHKAKPFETPSIIEPAIIAEICNSP